MSVEVVRLGELLDERAAAPGGGAGGARRGRSARGGGAQGRQARLRPAAPLVAPHPVRAAPLRAVPQVGVRSVQLELSLREQLPSFGRPVRARVRRRRALITLHFGRAAPTARRLRGRAPLSDRQFRVVKVRTVSSGCEILYFTERKVAAVHCRCDIKAAACNKIETFRLPSPRRVCTAYEHSDICFRCAAT